MVGHSWSKHKAIKKISLEGTWAAASSSCCERNWSTYGFIHSAARNKLTPARAADLVFTHNNHRLLSRNSQAYLTGPSKMWDIGGDGVESFGGVGMLEGADLSLDEPALEEEIIDSLT
uniref:HAT C-terminal dimerisation domain-containing protein n=1 Tax=Hordeum vulgare subsp. vulgare TaxID=112509 RepID=A0A8I6YHV8_HORVV